jgi:hypothetical protein
MSFKAAAAAILLTLLCVKTGAQNPAAPISAPTVTLQAEFDFKVQRTPSANTSITVLLNEGTPGLRAASIAYQVKDSAGAVHADGYQTPAQIPLSKPGLYTLLLKDTVSKATYVYANISALPGNENTVTANLVQRGRLVVEQITFNDKKESVAVPLLSKYKVRCSPVQGSFDDSYILETNSAQLPAGRYIIVVDCLPKQVRITEVLPHATTVVQVPLPGLAEVTLASDIATATIFAKDRNDTYTTFCAKLHDSISSIELQPGMYMAKWRTKNKTTTNLCYFTIRASRYTQVAITAQSDKQYYSPSPTQIFEPK